MDLSDIDPIILWACHPNVLLLSDLTYEYIQRGGLRDPIIFEKPDGLGIK